MTQLKGIHIKLNLDGKGIVNYDAEEQKYYLRKTNLNMYWKYSNVKYAKKNFYGNNGDYKIKISHDCLLADMYKYDFVSKNPSLVHNDAVLCCHLANPATIVRGELLASSSTYKRKSALTLNDAEQTCDAVSIMESFNRSGEKVTLDQVDVNDNSFYHAETIGAIKYGTDGFLDLKELQFLSCDLVYDRHYFDSDMFDMFKTFLKERMPSFNSELGYYKLVGSSDMVGEYGVQLSNEDCIFLVKETLRRMLNIYIKRKGSHAMTESLQIKFVYNPLVDTLKSDDGWITVDETFINNLTFDMFNFYEKLDENEIRERKAAMLERKKEIDEIIKKRKQDKTKKQESKKSKKSNNDDNTSDDE